MDYITSNSNLLPSQVGQICASRESFEEINLLLTTKSFNSKVDLKEWRQKVTNQPEEFINLYRHLNTKIPIDRLCYYSNWISPLHFKENRFDTQFFMTVVNDDERNACVPDGREIVDLEWSSPIDIITRFENGGNF